MTAMLITAVAEALRPPVAAPEPDCNPALDFEKHVNRS